MFVGSTPCTIENRLSTDVYGQETLSPAVSAMCGVVKLRHKSQHTTVRADSSGTRGAANEDIVDAVLLLPIAVKVDLDDRITVNGVAIQVTGVFLRRTVGGVPDHNEVDGVIWK